MKRTVRTRILVWIGSACTALVLGCVCTALVLVYGASTPERTLSRVLPPYVSLPNGRDPFDPDQFVRDPISPFIRDAEEGVIPSYEQLLDRPLEILELSGGGQNGAFGAGFLKGWQESGNRPSFDVVTGVSTGTLLATHAFLGTPEDDAVLEEIFTHVGQDDVYRRVGILGVLSGASSLFDTHPLQGLIEEFITPDVISRMAQAYDENRRLWVATTNLDYNQTWVWDLTLMAKMGKEDALETYRKVLLASASFPIAFQPVEIAGHLFADGATRENLLVVGLAGTKRPEPPAFGPGNIYVIHNGRSMEEPAAVSADVKGIAGTAIGGMMSSSTQSILLLAYLATKAQGYHFNVVEIPDDIDTGNNPLAFNTDQMRASFGAGYELGKQSNPWRSAPPHSTDYPDWIFEDR